MNSPINKLQLRSFHAVAEEGSFTKAADRLGVSQPTLSEQVRALEQRYGVRLFERVGRGVDLTDLGRRLRDVTRRITADEVAAEALLASARGLRSGRLRVMADAPHLLLPILGLFHRRHPEIQLSIGFGNTSAVRLALKDRRCDVAVLPDLENDPGVVSQLLRRDRLIAMVARDQVWRERRSVGLEDLLQQTLLLREQGSGTRARLERALAEACLTPTNTLEVGSREAIAEAAAAGLGVGVVSESEFGHDRRLRKLEIRGANLTTSEYLVCLAIKSEEPTVRALLEAAQELAE
ncbi:LysR substrate-binding domain-containing protein [Limibacillus halophilus]|uniref:Aminoethylphosphonate catabolism LysR family transcriptional regulator n=1 Tax=Limibacillus halophilus TaxID=1579333 RepID=A0A839SMY9_9PROT|nr:LysR substrate-binding domain-containing protein [Limibacillus halophilus]MBB3063812.1 aminoethylphosphonate catabolism LysR family transcriptional regulator [Limibacillus halophilus]